MVGRMVVLISSGSVEHLLQLAATSRIGGRTGIGDAPTVLRDIEGSDVELRISTLHVRDSVIHLMRLLACLRLNLAGAVVLVSTLVDTAVLNTVGTGDVLGHLQRLGQLSAVSLRTPVDAVLGKFGIRVDTVGVVGLVISTTVCISTILTFIRKL